MQRLHGRINPHSLGDLAIWIFVAMFFMIFFAGLVRLKLNAEQAEAYGKALQMGGFVAVGLVFLGARKLVSRKIRAELDAGAPGPFTKTHSIAMSVLGGMSVIFVMTALVIFLAGMLTGKVPEGEGARKIPSKAVFVAMAAVAPFLAGLWAGWRAGFAGWAFGGLSYLILQVLALPFPQESQPSLTPAEGLDTAMVWAFVVGVLMAAAGGYLGALIYGRKVRLRAAAGDVND
jgi:hypothetical protein